MREGFHWERLPVSTSEGCEHGRIERRSIRVSAELDPAVPYISFPGVRDVALREDASRLRKGALPRVWAAFANMAISILRLLKIEGVKRRMNQLHLSPDSAVELLLG